MKKILIALLIALLVFAHHWNTYAEEQQFCLNCGAVVTSNFCPDCGQSSTASLPEPAADETYLSVKISYEKNAILAKYDVDVELDGEPIGVIRQKDVLQKLIVVKKGVHELKLSKGGKHAVSILINATDKCRVSCTVKAHLVSLELKDILNSSPLTEAAQLEYAMSQYASECKDVDRERFCRYPEEFTNQKTIIKGSVVATAENFAGAMKVVVKDSKNELWIVEYIRGKTDPRLLVNDHVEIYGACKGITDYTSSVDVYPNLPTVLLAYLKLK